MPTLRQKYLNIYWAWKAMKQRTLNPKCRAYKNYGGRGIGICDEWIKFEPFCEWALESGWHKGLDLDRKDNNGDYSPENCRWVDRRANINNRRRTVVLCVNGEERPLTHWAELIGCDRALITSWVKTHCKQYAEQRIAEALKNGYKRRDFSRNHIKTSVVCVETQRRFESIKEAGRIMDINSGNISRVIRTGGTAGGYHFVKL